MAVMESSSPMNTQQCETALQPPSAGCCTLLAPECVCPQRQTHYLKRNTRISSSNSSWCVPLLMSSSDHPAPSKQFSFLPPPARQLPCSTPLPSVRDSGIWSLTPQASQQSTQDQWLRPPIPQGTWDHPCYSPPTLYVLFPPHFPHSCSSPSNTLEMGLLEYSVFLPADLPGPCLATSLLHGLQGAGTRPQMKGTEQEAGTASPALWQLQGCSRMSKSALRGQGTCNSSESPLAG